MLRPPVIRTSRGLRFRNWARSISARPEAVALPGDDAEVAAVLAGARAQGRRVRAVGAGHAWTAAAATDDVMLSLDRMRRVLAVDVAQRRVTVEGGIRLHELNAALARAGLALENAGSVAEQSLAGAIALGTHGTGLDLPCMSAQVEALRLVTPAGDIRDVDAGSEAELFAAARLSLGCLGVVTRVTLRVVPAYCLIEDAHPLPLAQALDLLPALLARHERLKLWWLPHADVVQVFGYDRTGGASPPPAALPARLARLWDRSPLLYGGFTALLALGARRPGIVPVANALVARSYFKPRRRVDCSDRIHHIAMPPRHLEIEYAVPAERARDALEGLQRAIADERLAVNFVCEVRWVAADDLLLSPCQGRPSCMIVAGIASGSRDHEAWFRAYERVMLGLGGRPHWGKAFTLDAPALRERFPGYARFAALRRSLDPDAVLVNPFIARIFGLGAPAPV